MFNQIYQNFCFLVKRMCWIFLIHLKLFFFFFAPTTPYFLKFWGLPSPWGLWQLPNSPRGRVSPAYREWLLIQLSSQMRGPYIPQASPIECSSKCNLIANYLRAKFTKVLWAKGIVKHLISQVYNWEWDRDANILTNNSYYLKDKT